MELKDYLFALRKRWFFFAVSVLLGLGLAATATLLSPRSYEARADRVVSPRSGTSTVELVQGSSYVLDRVKSYARVIPSELVVGPVADELDLGTTGPELSRRVTATVVEDTAVVVVAARADTAQEAADIANSVATRFFEIAPTLDPEGGGDGGVVNVTVINQATPPLSPVSPQPTINLALGLLTGVAVGLGGAVTRQALDRRIQDGEQIRHLSGAPILGRIPADSAASKYPLIRGASNFSPRAESLRKLRTNVQVGGDTTKQAQPLVITSSVAGEGRTVTALNLAITLAEAGRRVCFVEADLRDPDASSYLELDATLGLTHWLSDQASTSEIIQKVSANLDAILAGAVPPNPADLLASPALTHLLETLRHTYDALIVDTPPLLAVTDATILAKQCDGAILVVGLGRNAPKTFEVTESIEAIATVNVPVRGVVLNKTQRRAPRTNHVQAHGVPSPEPSTPPDTASVRSAESPSKTS